MERLFHFACVREPKQLTERVVVRVYTISGMFVQKEKKMETMNGDQGFVSQSFTHFLVYDEVARVWRERSSMARAFW